MKKGSPTVAGGLTRQWHSMDLPNGNDAASDDMDPIAHDNVQHVQQGAAAAHAGIPVVVGIVAMAALTGGKANEPEQAADVIWKGFRKGSLAPHFKLHGDEFPGVHSAADYLDAAKAFASERSPHFIQGKIGSIMVKVDPMTLRVLIGNFNSREIRTFYKASEGDFDPFDSAMATAHFLIFGN